MTQQQPVIVYDGECPFCSRYVTMLRLREAIGPVKLFNAREGGPIVERLESLGYDLDGGMVLEMDGEIHYGADCINRLAFMTTPSTAFNKLNAAIFRSRTASKVLYPILRAGRDATLALLGRGKIKDRVQDVPEQN